jgi:hypothetical protein
MKLFVKNNTYIMYMVQKLELFPTSYEYSIGKYNNLKEIFVRGDVDISGNNNK